MIKKMFDIEDDRMFVLETAIKHKLGTKEEINLYEELTLALELMKDDDFTLIDSSIGNGIDFEITTRYPHGLPERVGNLFFNISTDFDVKVDEKSYYVYNQERCFVFKIKKH